MCLSGIVSFSCMLPLSRSQDSIWNIDDFWQRETKHGKLPHALKASAWNLHRSFTPIFHWLEKVARPPLHSEGLRQKISSQDGDIMEPELYGKKNWNTRPFYLMPTHCCYNLVQSFRYVNLSLPLAKIHYTLYEVIIPN